MREVARLSGPKQKLSAKEVAALTERLGEAGRALEGATDFERADLYAALGLRLDYEPAGQRLLATLNPGRVASSVRRGT